jgi:hypothetical protein
LNLVFNKFIWRYKLSDTKNKGYPQSTIKKNKTNGTSRDSERNASTTSRLVRGSLDGTPRPCSDSYEARSTRRLDYREISDSHDPGSARSTPPHSSTLRQKSEHLMQTTNHFLPSWLQQQPAWEQYRCQISLFTAHPGMGGKNLSLYAPYWALFHH